MCCSSLAHRPLAQEQRRARRLSIFSASSAQLPTPSELIRTRFEQKIIVPNPLRFARIAEVLHSFPRFREKSVPTFSQRSLLDDNRAKRRMERRRDYLNRLSPT